MESQENKQAKPENKDVSSKEPVKEVKNTTIVLKDVNHIVKTGNVYHKEDIFITELQPADFERQKKMCEDTISTLNKEIERLDEKAIQEDLVGLDNLFEKDIPKREHMVRHPDEFLKKELSKMKMENKKQLLDEIKIAKDWLINKDLIRKQGEATIRKTYDMKRRGFQDQLDGQLAISKVYNNVLVK